MSRTVRIVSRWLVGFAAIALSLAFGPPIASAQTIVDAETAWLEADFDHARELFEAVTAAPGSSPADLLSAYRHLAVIASMQQHPEDAARAATFAVALERGVTAPAGAPASAATLFDDARAASSAEMDLVLEVGSETPLSLSATLVHAPDELVARLHLSCRGDGPLRAEESGPPPTVRLALSHPEDTPRCEAEALSAGGARLLDASLSLATAAGAGVADAAMAASDEPARGGDDTLLWVLVGAGAAVLVGVVIVVAVVVAGGGSGGPNVGGVVVRGW